MAKGGRPKKEIDKKVFENLCGLQCTLNEIASAFDCSTDTVERWCRREYKKGFAEVFSEKREKGRISLRRKQWQLAEKSPAMAIFLGKNYLGQTDKQDVEVSGPNNAPIALKHKHDLSGLSMSEQMALAAIMAKLEGKKNGPTDPS